MEFGTKSSGPLVVYFGPTATWISYRKGKRQDARVLVVVRSPKREPKQRATVKRIGWKRSLL